MNICMFTNTYLPHVGGVARSVHLFAEDIRRMGHRVLIVAPEFNGSIAADANPSGENDVMRLPALQEFNGSDFSVRIPIPYIVERKIDEFIPDIIHSHHPFLLGDTALRVARRKSLPLVFTHHTLYEQYTHYVPLNSDRMEPFVINLATLYANLAQGVVAPSASIADLIQARGGRVPIAKIPTGVDVAFFHNADGRKFRQAFDISPEALVVGHLGRLAPEKNLTFLTKSSAHFLKRYSKAVFLVVGEGPSKEEMRQYFRKAGLSDRLILAGQQTGDSLAQAYAAMDLFLFTSLSETQGMVLAEAMAAGLPAIALDASGVRDIVRNDKNGLLLPDSASLEDFADAIRSAVMHPQQLQKWRREAKKTAQAQSREVCARKLVDFYNRAHEELQSTETKIANGELTALDVLVDRIKVEWDLLSTKIKSAMDAVPSKDVKSKEESTQ